MQAQSRFRRWLPVTVLPLLFGLVGCGEPQSESPQELTAVEYYQLDPTAVARGEAIYAGSCANFCHAVEDDEAANLFDCEWVHGSSDEELHGIITEGIANTRMVGFGSNFPDGDNDVWRLIAFIRQNQPQCATQADSETQ
ncbi:MAG: cytochrome c [Pseudohongiellaceae bacterium]